jgi:beta-N-acetylhexosaminidase
MQVNEMTLGERIGQLICGRWNSDTLEQEVADGRIGSVYGCLGSMETTAAAAEFCNHLQQIAKYPLLFVGEQEHGNHRLIPGGTEFPAYMATGATRNKQLAYQFGRICALEARACGFAWIACPTVDVNIEPANPIINTRALSDDPALVTELSMGTLRGIVEHRGLTCVCHAPGHGATTCDSHLRMPTVDRTAEELWEVELAPYRSAIPAGVMNLIMTAHVYYPAWEPEDGLPATLSKNIMTGILREKLGFEGIIATDGMGMKAIFDNFTVGEAAVRALKAGCDIQLSPDVEQATAGILEAVESGRIPMAHLDAAVERILSGKQWAGLFDNAIVDPQAAEAIVGCDEHQATARQVAREAITMLRADGLPIAPTARIVLIGTSDDERLAEAVRRRCQSVECFDAVTQRPQALAAAQNADAAIVGIATRVRSSDEDSIQGDEALLGLINQLPASGAHISLLVLGNPYIVNSLPDADVCLCSYSDCQISTDAAVAALFGEFEPTGLLPIHVSDRYPFGHRTQL